MTVEMKAERGIVALRQGGAVSLNGSWDERERELERGSTGKAILPETVHELEHAPTFRPAQRGRMLLTGSPRWRGGAAVCGISWRLGRG